MKEKRACPVKEEPSASEKSAKELYFDNFGNFHTMDKNGEYCEYIKKKASAEEEQQWSVEIREMLIDDIVKKKDFVKIVPLSRVNLPENEIVEAFRTIAQRCSKAEVREMLKRLHSLIAPEIYQQIFPLFL